MESKDIVSYKRKVFRYYVGIWSERKEKIIDAGSGIQLSVGEGFKSELNPETISQVENVLSQETDNKKINEILQECLTLIGKESLTWEKWLDFFYEQAKKDGHLLIDTKSGRGTTKISNINLEHVDRNVAILGTLRNFSQILIKVEKVVYVCESCGQIHKKEVQKCAMCKSSYLQKHQEKYNTIKATVQEDVPVDDGSVQARSLPLEFRGDIKSLYQELNLGKKYIFIGTIKTARKKHKEEILYMECVKLHKQSDGFEAIELVGDDHKEIQKLSQSSNLFQKLRRAIFGNDLYNLDPLMDACILQMAGSIKTYSSGVLKNRGNLMFLLVGSPGKGKSQLLKRVAKFWPQSRYATGSGSSAIGLTATVSKDDHIGEFVLTPGTVALCHAGGIACIDEIDKISKDDLTKMNTMMDSLVIPIDKANIHRKLPADVSILAAMNPKYGTFDLHDPLLEQINLKKDFMDRFDLIFNIDYFNSDATNEKALKKSLDSYLFSEDDSMVSRELAIKYLVECRKVNPKLGHAQLEQIEKDFKELIGVRIGSTEAYFSLRLLHSLISLVLAHARIRLSQTVDMLDIKSAVEMTRASFQSLGLIHDGKLDVFKTERVVSQSVRNKAKEMIAMLKSLGGDKKAIPIVELEDMMAIENFDEILHKLKQVGDILEPKLGYVKILK